MGGVWRGIEGKGRLFFFEKKNQKTFVTLAGACGVAVTTRTVPVYKVFLLLFVHKKKTLPFLLLSLNNVQLDASQTP
jgi:hypothetical protein